MARLLKTKGLLIASIDYRTEPIDTGNQYAYGVSIHIFDEQDVRRALHLAYAYGFLLLRSSPATLNLNCIEKAVERKQYNLQHTFML